MGVASALYPLLKLLVSDSVELSGEMFVCVRRPSLT